MTEKVVTVPPQTVNPPPAVHPARLWLRQRWLAWRTPLIIFLVWRLWFIPVALLAGVYIPTKERTWNTFFFIPTNFDGLYDRFLDVWQHWDGQWFREVALVGYQPGAYTTPYFPLYPLLTKILMPLTGGHFLPAALVVSNIFALATFIAFYELVKQEFSKRVATLSLVCLAVFPTSFFLVACYSEGVFLALTLAAFRLARRNTGWPWVGLLVGLAALSRNMGILLLIPLGWEWLRHNWQLLPGAEGRSFWRRLNIPWATLFSLPTLFFAGVPLLCFGGWMFFNWLVVGDPLSFVTLTASPYGWNRQPSPPWQTLGYIFQLFFRERPKGIEDRQFFDLPFWIFTVALWLVVIYLTWRRKWPLSYLLFFTLALLLPMSGVNPVEPLNSFPRYSLLAFPMFMALGSARGRWNSLTKIYIIVGMLMLSFLFARFSVWFWVG